MPFDAANALLQNAKGKKKRRYILFLYSSKYVLESDLRTVEKAAASSLRDCTLVRMEDPDEALKILLVKHVDMLIMDHSFLNDESLSMEYASEVKKRKKCPILFLARDERKLIAEYRKQLFLYEELDDYILSPVDFVEVGRRLKRAATVDGRAAKRFHVASNVKVYRLDTNSMLAGSVTDLSLVGFGLSIAGNELFRRNEQLQIQIHLQQFDIFHPYYGDFLKLSGRVRRISIDGKKVGCSIEHITPMQNDCLIKILEILARKARIKRFQQVRKPVAQEAG